MKILVASFLLFNMMASAQSDFLGLDTIFARGDNSFNLSVKSIQSYFINNKTINEFEKTLGKYYKPSHTGDTVFFASGDLRVTMPYNLLKNDSITDIVSVSYNKENKINELNFYLKNNSLSDFENQMKEGNYYYDSLINQRYAGYGSKRTYYSNKENNIIISIFTINEHKTSVYFTNYKN